MHPTFYWIAVALVIVVATSRLVRLWTYDDFPPVAWANDKVSAALDAVAPSYGPLTFCPWCCGFWVALAVIGLGYPLDIYDWVGWPSLWWTVMGALAASYLAAMLMVRDGDTSNDDPADQTASAV